MNKVRKALGMATIAAMLVTSSAPVLARPGHGGYGNHGGYGHGGYGRRGHREGDGFGNFLLGAVVVGGIIAVASAASRNARQTRTASEASRPGSDIRSWSDAENDAAGLCADAAEAMASKRDAQPKVDDIEYVEREGDDGYRVEGRLAGGKAFVCGINRGELTYVQFSDGAVAAR